MRLSVFSFRITMRRGREGGERERETIIVPDIL
jgi:hypothetical protein